MSISMSDIERPNVISIQRETAEGRDPVFEFLRSINNRVNRINCKESERRLSEVSEIDIGKMKLEAIPYNDNESLLSVATLLARLRGAGHVRLDAYVLLSMMKNPLRIPKKWQMKCEAYMSRVVILFAGTVLSDGADHHYVLGLSRRKNQWEVCIHQVECNYTNDQVLFAVLPK